MAQNLTIPASFRLFLAGIRSPLQAFIKTLVLTLKAQIMGVKNRLNCFFGRYQQI
jgi:hypothetical protein